MADIVIVVGLVLGSLAIGTACAVWWRHQQFGTGGSFLSVVGLVLVGMSIWSRVSFSVGGATVDLERLAQRVEDVARAGEEVSEAVAEVAEGTETTRRQFVDLTRALERQRTLPPQQLEELRQPLVTDPVLRPDRLRRANELLRTGGGGNLQRP